jgi:hypothetical protein
MKHRRDFLAKRHDLPDGIAVWYVESTKYESDLKKRWATASPSIFTTSKPSWKNLTSARTTNATRMGSRLLSPNGHRATSSFWPRSRSAAGSERPLRLSSGARQKGSDADDVSQHRQPIVCAPQCVPTCAGAAGDTWGKLEVQIGVRAELIKKFNAGRLDVVFAKRPLGTSKGRLGWREPLIWAAADVEGFDAQSDRQLS